MALLSIVELLTAAAFFTALGGLSYLWKHGKSEAHAASFHTV